MKYTFPRPFEFAKLQYATHKVFFYFFYLHVQIFFLDSEIFFRGSIK